MRFFTREFLPGFASLVCGLVVLGLAVAFRDAPGDGAAFWAAAVLLLLSSLLLLSMSLVRFIEFVVHRE